jgi:hypothetical protein
MPERNSKGQYASHKMPDGSMMKNKDMSKGKGLTPKQKANLPVALQKAILAKRRK